MEDTESAVVIPLDAHWNDLGTWDALWDIDSKDENGNVVSGDVLVEAVSNSYIQSNSRLVAAVGVEDVVIVETPDALLVARKGNAQSVRQIVEQLERAGREEINSHTKVFRPWGYYESLAIGDSYQVKRLMVSPGESISLQLHHHRAEHWTVIKGTGLITLDNREFELRINESTFIPLGSKHRAANLGKEPLEIIEVQLGDYLGEDDIVRFEDIYGRQDKTST
jgi:mannose-1-phosphate guanylyltransferase/mannose-6-phosphate isomerase